MLKTYLKETIKYLLRSKPFIKKEINEVEKLYKMSDEELYRYKEEKFLKLFRRAITKSKFYKEFYGNAGIGIKDIQSLEDIKKLPVLTKDMVRKNYNDILTVPRWKVTKAHTSGTTGTPLTIYQDYSTIKKEQAYIWVRRKNYGFKYKDKQVSLRGNLNNSQFKMYVHASSTLYLSSYNINKNKSILYYKEIKRFKPKAIEGYPSSLYNLCVFLKEQDLKLKIPLAFTSSETLYDFQRNLIEDILETKIYDRYGCTERSISIAQKQNKQEYYEEPGYSINEYNDDSIFTTSLINNVFPLIRYEVNDIVDTKIQSDNIVIGSISGRKEDMIICKDGSLIGRIDHVFKGVNNVKFAQILQNQIGEIIVNIVPEENYSIKDKQLIIDNIYQKMGKNNIDIKIEMVSEKEIIYSSRNKFKLVVSILNKGDNE